jgi:hypothetical protein
MTRTTVLFKITSSRLVTPFVGSQYQPYNSQHTRSIMPTMPTDGNNDNIANNPWTVHSTFRNSHDRQVKPRGLEWNMDGDSKVYYAPSSRQAQELLVVRKDLNDDKTRQLLVGVHNRWCFAKDLLFRQASDMDKVEWVTDNHVAITWKPLPHTMPEEQRYTLTSVDGLLRMDPSAKGQEPPCQVWINGYLAGLLQPDTVESLVRQVQCLPSRRLVFRKHFNMIRIERRFQGRIQGQELLEHVVDNLIALEDVEIIVDDPCTMIGTATLPDWIMGGELTSRLWIRLQENGDVLFHRPLYHDDVKTSDRTYLLQYGKHNAKIAVVQQELDRLRFLTTLEHPFVAQLKTIVPELDVKEKMMEDPTPQEMQEKRNRRKFFGL